MEAYVAEWLNLLVRWLHLITGIAWIGSSFYFVWLDNHLEKPRDPADADKGVSGELWSVHGGGFYHNQKYQLGPKKLPETLHWFKWEAYFTWMSGFSLLVIVYYFGAESFLIDTRVADLAPWQAITIGLGALIVGLSVYEAMCASKLADHGIAFAVVGYVLVVAAAFILSHLFSGRAAYLHVGAMLGSIMAANVAHVIIPGQRKMVAVIAAGQLPDPKWGKNGKLRSVHNNYITLPVLFIMISNHYPLTYGHAYGWAVLAVIILAAVLIRHFFNLRHKGQVVVALPAAAAVLIGALAFAIMPKSETYIPKKSYAADEIAFDKIEPIIRIRCQPCHSQKPTVEAFAAPPLGVVLETPVQIKRMAQRILQQAVLTETMPAGNFTEMTDGERDLLGAWIAAGAKTN